MSPSASIPASISPTLSSPVDPVLQHALTNPLRKVALWLGVLLVFVRLSQVHQLLTFTLGVNLRLLYIIGIPALIALFLTDGVRRSFRFRPAFYWLGFALWIICVTPLSSWKGGSTELVLSYLRSEVVLLFIVGGTALTWRETKLVMYSIALAAVVNVLSSQIFSRQDINDRIGLEFGAIANPNDYAGQLILVLPFLLWVAMASKIKLIQLGSFLIMSYGIYVALASASRGAAVAIVAEVITIFFLAKVRVRLATIILAPLVLLIAAMVLPSRVYTRLLSFSESASGASEEALQSSKIRTTLFKDSIITTLQSPIWGVGPGQFSTHEGRRTETEGRGRLWFNPHNSYLQAAAEAGLPALFFYVGGSVSTLLLLRKLRKRVQSVPGLQEIDTAIFCTDVAMIGFCVVTFFLNFAYAFYLPLMGGLATSLAFAVITAQGSARIPVPATPVAPRLPYLPGAPRTAPPPPLNQPKPTPPVPPAPHGANSLLQRSRKQR